MLARRDANVRLLLSEANLARLRGLSRVLNIKPATAARTVLETYMSALEMAETKAVVFDMDGVLCDSEVLSRRAGVDLFAEVHGVQVQERDFADFTGQGEAFFLKGVADRYQVQGFDVEAAKAAFFRIYLSKYATQLEPFPGVKRLIDTLKTRGVRVALASSADAVKVDGNLNAIGIPRDTFDYVTHSDSIPRKKPAPDIFLAAAAGLGLEPRACVVIEDSEAGVIAAKVAGMRCVAVATSLSRNRLWKAGADTVFDSPEEITENDLIVTPEVAQLFQK